MTEQQTASPTLRWEFGTAYELFISLYVIHVPEKFSLRPSWASGVRSRIPAIERKLLEEVTPFIGFPLSFLHDLPGEKDAISALWALKQLPPADRLTRLLCLEKNNEDDKETWNKILLRIHQRRSWLPEDLEAIREMTRKEHEKLDEGKLVKFLDRWANPDDLGNGYLTALQAYHQAYFADEEKRLAPILQHALDRARQRSTEIPVADLLLELSQGVSVEELVTSREIVLIPAYWTTPLILMEFLKTGTTLFAFGARPADMAAIPGEMVPDALLRILKALADPTRLKIMYYLSQQEVTPSELARRLHLRAPTVTHHLGELRLSGLIYVTYRGQERHYRARPEALPAFYASLDSFLKSENEPTA
jgi:DNA-binding transcriptional ArsR family regulator